MLSRLLSTGQTDCEETSRKKNARSVPKARYYAGVRLLILAVFVPSVEEERVWGGVDQVGGHSASDS